MDLKQKCPLLKLFEQRELANIVERVWLYCFEKTGNLHCKFPLRAEAVYSLAVSDNNKVLVLGSTLEVQMIDVYKHDGRFVCSIGIDVLSDALDICY